MINNINISNLQLFNNEGYALPVVEVLQKQIQEGIANKVKKLLNTQEFITAFIPSNCLNNEINLHIHLTKDGIIVQVLEENLDPKQVKQEALSENVKIRKEKIIKKVNDLFKEPSTHTFATLQSKNIHSLFPSPLSSKEETTPVKISFDTHLSNSQAQKLNTKIQELQNQLNKQASSSKELRDIKEQLRFLEQAIQNLLNNTQNTQYPRNEEYTLINRLMDENRDICQALLSLLTRNLHQANTNTPVAQSPTQDPENSMLKSIISKLEIEKDSISSTLKSLSQKHEKTSQALEKKQQEINTLQQDLEILPKLQQEKTALELQQKNLTDQLDQATKKRLELSTAFDDTIKKLEEELSSRKKQVLDLETKMQSLPTIEAHKKLQKQKTTLENSNTLTNQAHKKTSQLLAQKQQEIDDLQENLLKSLSGLRLQLSQLQEEKKLLELEQKSITDQLNQATKSQIDSSATFTDKIKKLENANATLHADLFVKEKQILDLETKMQKPQEQIYQLEQEKTDLEKAKESAIKNHEKTTQLLAQKQQEIQNLQQNLKILPDLQSQISQLQEEKKLLELEQKSITDQLNQTTKNQIDSSATFADKIKKLQEDLFTKDKQVLELKTKIQSLPEIETYQKLKDQISQLEQEKIDLERAKESAAKNHEKAALLLAQTQQDLKTLPDLQSQLSKLQQEKENLESESKILIDQLKEVHQTLQNKTSQLQQEKAVLELEKNQLTIAIANQTALQETLFAEKESSISQLRQEILVLQETLDNIMPLADISSQSEIIEKMEKSHQLLNSQLTQKNKDINNLQEEIAILEGQLPKLKSQLKEFQNKQNTVTEQQKIIEELSRNNNDLLEELGKKRTELATEKKQRHHLEQTHKALLEELQDQYKETSLKRSEIISLLITDLEKKTPGSCMLLINLLKDYVSLKSITHEASQDILSLIEPAFKNTEAYKIFISSESKEDLQPSSLEGYEEESYFPNSTETIYQS